MGKRQGKSGQNRGKNAEKAFRKQAVFLGDLAGKAESAKKSCPLILPTFWGGQTGDFERKSEKRKEREQQKSPGKPGRNLERETRLELATFSLGS